MTVSAIIPTYNRRDYIRRAVDSVLAQTLPVDELLIIDDGSTDGTAEELEVTYGTRVRIVRQAQSGVSVARWRGIQEARGEWIAFLDSDDEWTPDRTRMLADATRQVPSDVAWIFGDLRLVDDAGEGPTLYEKHGLSVKEGVHILADALDVQFPFQFCMLQGSWIRRSVLLDLECFRTGLRSDDDLLAGFQVACRYRMAAVPSVVGKYFRTSDLAASSVVVNGVYGPDHYRSRMLSFGLVIESGRCRRPWNLRYAAEVRDFCKLKANRGEHTRGLALDQFRYGGISTKGVLFFCAALLGNWAIKLWTRAAAWRRVSMAVLAVLMVLCGVPVCHAVSLVMVGSSTHVFEQEQVRNVAGFYGLEVHEMDPGDAGLISRIKESQTVAVLVSQEALTQLDRERVLTALRRVGGSIPMLVFGVDSDRESAALKAWSGGVVAGCIPNPSRRNPTTLQVQGVAMSGALAGSSLPAVAVPNCMLQLQERAETVLSVRYIEGSQAVLVQVRSGAATVFFTPGMELFDRSWIGDPMGLSKAFSAMSPFFLVVGSAASDRSWHTAGHYANLTIDDPWLRQPYGSLDYRALLAEMRKHQFHTTIAFVPWNFDRSQGDLAALMRANPESYSFCLHGNDHEHREFGSYKTNSFPKQRAEIKQAIARMERFRALTGIAYDRFMVFPHGVAPEPTFMALRELNFLGTANSIHVPLDTPFPADPIFLLRPFTSRYGNLLSMFRYPAEPRRPRVELAIHSFLGNPLLFYGHENLFRAGAGAFNQTADLLNSLQPDTRWVSPGEIARRLYLIRRRDDDGFDVRPFSSEIDLENRTHRQAVYHIDFQGSCPAAQCSIFINGVRDTTTGNAASRVLVPPLQTIRVTARYSNASDLAGEPVNKGSLYTWALRLGSDFRDLYLSQSYWGRTFTQAYYEHRWDEVEAHLERLWPLLGACAILAVVCRLRYHYNKARRHGNDASLGA